MKSEALFQKNLIDGLNGIGVRAFHLSPPSHPGFPDLLCTYQDRFMLIEVKQIDDFDDRPFQQLFTKAQLPWIHNWLKKDGCTITVAIQIKATDSYLALQFSEPKEIVSALTATLSEMMEFHGAFHFATIGLMIEAFGVTIGAFDLGFDTYTEN